MLIVLIHPEQWNGGSDRCTVALLRHFTQVRETLDERVTLSLFQAGHRVIWLTTWIDEYWKDHSFEGVGWLLTCSLTFLTLCSFMGFSWFSLGTPWKSPFFTEIRKVALKLHPGDWFTQNVALGWNLVMSDINPDLVVVDHSAR